VKSKNKGKKYTARFTNKDKTRKRTIHFGAAGMSDYTKHRDKKRKGRYIARHKKRENWRVPDTAGSLSRWVLWGEPTLRGSVKKYKKKFNLK